MNSALVKTLLMDFSKTPIVNTGKDGQGVFLQQAFEDAKYFSDSELYNRITWQRNGGDLRLIFLRDGYAFAAPKVCDLKLAA